MDRVISIDGPSGSGKTTVACKIASLLKVEWLSSGAVYRAVTKLVLDRLIRKSNTSEIISLIQGVKFEVYGEKVSIDSVDVTEFLHVPEIDREISFISAISQVREMVNFILRKQINCKPYIVEGRDIGTEVFPEASIKIYLDSSSRSRALRRANQRGVGIDSMEFDHIENNIKERDFNDRNKEMGALRISKDAKYIDTTHLTVNEVCDMVMTLINNNPRKDALISYE